MTFSRNRLLVMLVSACALSAYLAGPAQAATEPEHPSELGFVLGFELPDRPVTGEPEKVDQLGLLWGVRAAPIVGRNVIWFIDATASAHDNVIVDGEMKLYTARTGAEWLFPPQWNYRWFVSGAGGYMAGRLKDDNNFNRPMVSVGFGMRGYTDKRTILRWEIRADKALGDHGLGEQEVTNLQGLVGFSWGIGGAPGDADGDGVSDRRDKCPGTPPGATVDPKGCPHDSDGDGVLDGLDKCPETPRGWPVDASGCPLDSDGDGVPDGIDACPNTPRGATVDAKGCPTDSDGDGVFDGIDACPNTPKGATVDARGCPLDSDGDGVFDGIDRCPDTPKGTPVDASGCPLPEPPKPPPIIEKKGELVLEGVNFDTDKATLTPASTPILDRVAASLNDYPEIRVVVEGHTDSVGGSAHNMQLSSARAAAVRDYLIGKGVAADRLSATGFGKTMPIADNKTEQGRARNRRVDLKRVD